MKTVELYVIINLTVEFGINVGGWIWKYEQISYEDRKYLDKLQWKQLIMRWSDMKIMCKYCENSFEVENSSLEFENHIFACPYCRKINNIMKCKKCRLIDCALYVLCVICLLLAWACGSYCLFGDVAALAEIAILCVCKIC